MGIRNPTPIEIIKQSITIVEVLDRYTNLSFPKNRNKFNINCLIHQEKNPSATVYQDSNVIFCHACKSRYDQIDVVQISMKLDKKTAIKTILKDFGINGSTSEDFRMKLLVEHEVKTRLKEVQEVISASRRTLSKLIQTEEDLEKFGGFYHYLDYYLNLEDTLSNGTFEQKKRAIAGTLDSGRR